MHFPAESSDVHYGKIWDEGYAVASRLLADNDRQSVAIILSNTRICATIIVGAIAAGLSLISVPMPPRGADIGWYTAFIERVCGLSGTTMLLAEATLARVLPPLADIRCLSFEAALAMRGPARGNPASFMLTQFTSGSTSDPRGIVLDGDRIAASLRAMVTWLEPGPGDGVCTWLPMSHDMGLIGTFLAPLSGASHAGAAGTDLVILPPRSFVRRPAAWLAACEAFGSTVTAAPSYAYELAARSGCAHDLSRLRVCIVGGEPIHASALDKFAESFRGCGFDPAALCPSYGMAEAVLAVTGTRAPVPWHACPLDALAPGAGEVPAGAGARPIVGCGKPLPGYEVRIDGGAVGEILVKGPSVADVYANGAAVTDGDGWFHTSDIGAMRDGELYVLGRTDDVFQVAGRNIYAIDVEAYASEVAGVCSRRVVAVPDGSTLTLVAECEPEFSDRANVAQVAQVLRQQIVSRLGLAPQRVLMTRRGSLPLTASGKIRRKPLLSALQGSRLDILPGSIE